MTDGLSQDERDLACDKVPIAHAAQREWRLPPSPHMALDALVLAWRRSQATIQSIRVALCGANFPACLRIVAVSGSLGRMEYGRHSDVDLIMIAQPGTEAGLRCEAGRMVWDSLAALDLRRPLQDGIFSDPLDESLLTARASLGEIAESKAAFGIRMQLLLDSQPVFGDHSYDLLVKEILNRFHPDPVGNGYGDALLDELIRYHRCLRTVYRWTRREEPAAWRSRDLKMIHSRLLMYAGLLFLLGEASRYDSSAVEWLADHLRLTPLERVAAMTADDDHRLVAEILQRYDRFLLTLGRADFPQVIARHDDDAEALQSNHLYRELRSSGEAFSDQLNALLLQRLPGWSASFRKKMIFGC